LSYDHGKKLIARVYNRQLDTLNDKKSDVYYGTRSSFVWKYNGRKYATFTLSGESANYSEITIPDYVDEKDFTVTFVYEPYKVVFYKSLNYKLDDAVNGFVFFKKSISHYILINGNVVSGIKFSDWIPIDKDGRLDINSLVGGATYIKGKILGVLNNGRDDDIFTGGTMIVSHTHTLTISGVVNIWNSMFGVFGKLVLSSYPVDDMEKGILHIGNGHQVGNRGTLLAHGSIECGSKENGAGGILRNTGLVYIIDNTLTINYISAAIGTNHAIYGSLIMEKFGNLVITDGHNPLNNTNLYKIPRMVNNGFVWVKDNATIFIDLPSATSRDNVMGPNSIINNNTLQLADYATMQLEKAYFFNNGKLLSGKNNEINETGIFLSHNSVFTNNKDIVIAGKNITSTIPVVSITETGSFVQNQDAKFVISNTSLPGGSSNLLSAGSYTFGNIATPLTSLGVTAVNIPDKPVLGNNIVAITQSYYHTASLKTPHAWLGYYKKSRSNKSYCLDEYNSEKSSNSDNKSRRVGHSGSKSDKWHRSGSKSDKWHRSGSKSDKWHRSGSKSDKLDRSGSKSDKWHRSGSKTDKYHRSGSKSDKYHRSGSKSDKYHRSGSKSFRRNHFGSKSFRRNHFGSKPYRKWSKTTKNTGSKKDYRKIFGQKWYPRYYKSFSKRDNFSELKGRRHNFFYKKDKN